MDKMPKTQMTPLVLGISGILGMEVESPKKVTMVVLTNFQARHHMDKIPKMPKTQTPTTPSTRSFDARVSRAHGRLRRTGHRSRAKWAYRAAIGDRTASAAGEGT